MDTEKFERTKNYRGRNMPLKRRILHLIRATLLSPVLIVEFASLSGKKHSTSKYALMFLNDLSNSTHGSGLDFMNKIIAFIRKKDTREFDKRVINQDLINLQKENISSSEFKSIVNQIKSNGFAKLPGFVSKDIIDEAQRAIYSSGGIAKVSKLGYREINDWLNDENGGPRFETEMGLLNETQLVKNFRSNVFINRVAREILGSSPICDSIQSWTTRAVGTIDSNTKDEAAMAFHADADYFGFLKFFVLITKVENSNGPFAFVKGSHRKARHVAGRMADHEILGENDEVLLGTGNPGDVVIACTAGWHKATPPQEGKRTMVQFLFTSSLFGKAT